MGSLPQAAVPGTRWAPVGRTGREGRNATMIITEKTKRAIPFTPEDAKRVGDGCYYMDQIVWLNGEHIELDDGVGFNYGCYVNGIGGLVIGEATIFGPYTMIHTANPRPTT